MTAVEACRLVNEKLPKFRMDKDFPQMSFSQLMATTRGQCDGMTALTCFTMRSLGIPVTIDFTPHWVKMPNGHSWNTVCDSTGKHISFMGTESGPDNPHQGNTLPKSKAYRHTFALQKNTHADSQNIPPLLNNINNIKDISGEHSDCSDTLAVPILYSTTNPTGYVYLALFYEDEWYPLAWTEASDSLAIFTHVGRNIIYLPTYYTNGMIEPAGDPFRLNENGTFSFFSPNSPQVQLELKEISPSADPLYLSTYFRKNLKYHV